ncbi:MAG: hypothetical protein ABIR98_14600 [Usitatibacter sp.]
MSDKDIFGKADALLKRHSPARPGTEASGVPVLTDLVESPAARAAPSDPLAREVFMRVMAKVEGRLAADLESRLTRHLVAQIHAAVSSAIGDLHQEIANAIGDAVAEALKARNVK